MSKFNFANKKASEPEKQFWDKEEIQCEVIKDEKNKIVIFLAIKDGKTFLVIQKKYKSLDEWKNGKGFTMEFDEIAKEVLKKSLEVCDKYAD